ncbi:hypothetical protein RJ55_04941 [Drechmeria coniospora]|nr:hypothetical protein RJ55_04941 [Drechmeria coniospora]
MVPRSSVAELKIGITSCELQEDGTLALSRQSSPSCRPRIIMRNNSSGTSQFGLDTHSMSICQTFGQFVFICIFIICKREDVAPPKHISILTVRQESIVTILRPLDRG